MYTRTPKLHVNSKFTIFLCCVFGWITRPYKLLLQSKQFVCKEWDEVLHKNIPSADQLNAMGETKTESIWKNKTRIWSNKRFTDARNSMKCDALLLTEWFLTIFCVCVLFVSSCVVAVRMKLLILNRLGIVYLVCYGSCSWFDFFIPFFTITNIHPEPRVYIYSFHIIYIFKWIASSILFHAYAHIIRICVFVVCEIVRFECLALVLIFYNILEPFEWMKIANKHMQQ